MTPLAAIVARSSDDELRATRRLLHRAFLGRDRLGWPTLNPFSRRAADPDLGEPVILAAACLEISAELERRRAALPCLPCRGTVEQDAVLAGTALEPIGAPGPVPSAAVTAGGS